MGNAKVIEVYKEVDEKIYQLSKVFPEPEIFLEPANENLMKKLFFEGKINDVEFKYQPHYFDVNKYLKLVKNVDVPEGMLKELYEERKKEIILHLLMIKYRGNAEKMRELSSELYGVVDLFIFNKALAVAKGILGSSEQEKNEGDGETIKGSELINLFNTLIKRFGLEKRGWKAIATGKKLVSVSPVEKLIRINPNREFTIKYAKRLVVHEFFVHTFRGENGHMQPLKIFLKFPKYLETEEGLAVYFERNTGYGDDLKFAEYAGRVIAVRLAYEGKSFKYIFDYLLDLGFEKETAWNLCFRVFRGGCFLKDFVYFKGYLDLERHRFEKDLKVQYLYCGKVGLKNIDLVKDLISEKIIKKPQILPPNLKELRDLSGVKKFVEDFFRDYMSTSST